MARNGSGVYNLPAGINPVVPGTTIDTNWANPTLTDVATALTGSLATDGQSAMVGVLKLTDGTAMAPGLAFNSEASTGFFRPGTGIIAFTASAVEQGRLTNGNLLLGSTANSGERLQVTGTTKLAGNTAVTGTLSVSGTSNLSAVTMGALSATTGTFSSTLGVTGTSTLGVVNTGALTATTGTFSSTLGVTGDTTLSGTLGVGGAASYKVHVKASGSGAVVMATSTDGGGAETYMQSNSTSDGRVGTFSSHPFNIITAATVRATFATTGNVGIGAAPSGARLDVGGGINTAAASRIGYLADTDAATYAGVSSANYGITCGAAYTGFGGPGLGLVGYSGIMFGTAASERMRILSGGALCIGTTSQTGIGGGADTVAIAGTLGLQGQVNFNAATGQIVNRAASGGFKFYTDSASIIPVSIESNGSVGIGTTGSGVFGDLSLARAGGTTGVLHFGTASGKYIFQDSTKFNVRGGNIRLDDATTSGFETFSGALMRDNQGTYGGIELHGAKGGYQGLSTFQSGGYRIAHMFETSGNGGTYNESLGVWHTYWVQSNTCLGIGGSTTAPGYRAYTNGSHYVAGDLYATGNVTAYSDQRIKKNVFTISNALAKVEALRGVMYVRKDNDQAGTGVIAQEVEKVLPEVITEDHNGMKGVAYGNMVGLLIEAVKELTARVRVLEAA